MKKGRREGLAGYVAIKKGKERRIGRIFSNEEREGGKDRKDTEE